MDLPSLNPQASGLIRVTGFPGQGLTLEITDPLGSRIWRTFLEAEGATDQFVTVMVEYAEMEE